MCSAQLVLSLDVNVVNIANASIERALHFGSGNLQWTVTAYALTFGGFLLLGGRMADLFGPRRLFMFGVAGFAAASLCAGLSQDAAELIASRAAQGLCAAVVSPAVLSLLAATFREGRPRQRAYGIWAMAGSFGGLVGLLLGGIITSLLGWRWIFFINAPIATLAIIGAATVLPKALLKPKPSRRLDLAGAITVTAGLALVIYGLGEAHSSSWTSKPTLAALAVAPLLLLAFYSIERRAEEPLLPFALLRRRAVVASALAIFQQSVNATTAFLTPLFMQQVWGFSPVRASVSTLPLPIGFAVGARLSARLVGRIGAKRIILTGFCLMAASCVWLTQVPVHQSYFTSMLPPSFLRSVGLGLVVVAVVLAVTAGVRREDQGIAAGLFNMSQQLGGAFGLAAIATVAAAAAAAGGRGIVGEAHGIRIAFLATLGLPLIAVIITFFGPKNAAPEDAVVGLNIIGTDPTCPPITGAVAIVGSPGTLLEEIVLDPPSPRDDRPDLRERCSRPTLGE